MSFSIEKRKRLLSKKKKPSRLTNKQKATLKKRAEPIPKSIKPLSTDTSWLIKPSSLRKTKSKDPGLKLLKLIGAHKTTTSKQGGKVYRRAGGAVRGWGKAQRGY